MNKYFDIKITFEQDGKNAAEIYLSAKDDKPGKAAIEMQFKQNNQFCIAWVLAAYLYDYIQRKAHRMASPHNNIRPPEAEA